VTSPGAGKQGPLSHLDTQKIRLAGLPTRRVKIGVVQSPVAALLNRTLTSVFSAGSLLLAFLLTGVKLNSAAVALVVIVVIASMQLIKLPAGVIRRGEYLRGLRDRLPTVLIEWTWLTVLLVFIDYSMNETPLLTGRVIICWCILGPALLLNVRVLKQLLTNNLPGGALDTHRYVIVGANELAIELNRRALRDPQREFVGYFDDRSNDRLPRPCLHNLLGNYEDVCAYVKANQVDAVYITLPVATNSRMRALIKELRDTTVSVYVVPLIMFFDTIQARMSEIEGMPVVSMYDTPLDGVQAIYKRALDVTVSLLILLMIWPLLLTIAVGVKLSSPGPVLFKQHRYGINGERISVYKFRSMRAQENGTKVVQATRGDARITRFGSFLRRTSLDELPQIINVLEGKMSLVGPRPHAVAHNEEYRKLIDGYMFRHKVRPGITGWAQVNGLRGETETIDKMQARINYDLDYLRNWSLWLDIKIIFKTGLLLFGDPKAY
jgi:putative colanic acid biosysnthesis UDP-glucose lipid carrier transferase